MDAPPNAEGLTLADLLPNSMPGPDDEAERAELRQTARATLAQLSSEQRAAVVLRYDVDIRKVIPLDATAYPNTC